MDTDIYMALAELCGECLLRLIPGRLPCVAELMPATPCAVYLATDSNGAVCYVGSVCRPGDPEGLGNHIAQYLSTLPKASKWHGVYVLPLKPSTPELTVRQIADDVARWMLPYDRERWPQAS